MIVVCFFQTVLRGAGSLGQQMAFLITDTQIKEEVFLEDIDSLLNTGFVPNLFTPEEKAEIMEVSIPQTNDFHLNFSDEKL